MYNVTSDFVLVGNHTRHNVWSVDCRAGYAVSRSLVSGLYHCCCSQLSRCRYLPKSQCFKPSYLTVENACIVLFSISCLTALLRFAVVEESTMKCNSLILD